MDAGHAGRMVRVLVFLILAGCGVSISGDELAGRLAGRTLVLDHVASDDPSWPPLRWTFGADGTWTGTFRSVMQPHRPHTVTGYWWVDGGQLCRGSVAQGSGNNPGLCYVVTLDGDRFEGSYPREFFRPIPHFTLPPRGTLVN